MFPDGNVVAGRLAPSKAPGCRTVRRGEPARQDLEARAICDLQAMAQQFAPLRGWQASTHVHELDGQP